MNRLQIRQKARRKLDETSAKFWTDEDLNDFINQGYRYYWQWMIQAGQYITLKETNLDIVASTSTIALPSDFIKVKMLERVIDGIQIPLDYYDRTESENYTTGVSTANFLYSYRLLGANLVLEPTPQESATSGLKLTYFYMMDEMDDDSDIPLIPLLYHDLLVSYAVIQAKEKEEGLAGGGADMSPFVMTMQQQEQLFKESIEPDSLQSQFVRPMCF